MQRPQPRGSSSAHRALLATALAFAALPFARAETNDPSPYGWILQHQSTNGVVWDPHWPTLAANSTPRFDLGRDVYNRRLLNHFQAGMGGPPDPVQIVDDRYIVLGACVPHDCLSKSFLWIDPVTATTVGAIADYSSGLGPPPRFHATLVLFSRSLACHTLPAAFDAALARWIQDMEMTIDQVSFVGPSGRLDARCRDRR